MTKLFLPKLIKSIFSSAFALITICNSYSQNSAEYEHYREKYPNSQYIRLNQESILNIDFKDGKFQINEEVIEEDLYLDERAKFNAKQELNYSTFIELNEIEASTYSIVNNDYQEIKVTDFREKDELDDSFYDDIKTVNFIYPRLGTGSKTKLRYIETIKNPRFLNAFYFGNFYPIKNNKITIVASKNVSLRFQEFNMEGIPVVFTQKETRKNNIYTWEMQDMEDFKYEDNAPNYKSILPHIIPIIESFQMDGDTIKIGDDISSLYDWYYGLTKNLNKANASDDLINIVENLIKDKKNELEKVRAIYYWVQENIKYIAFEYALGGFVPREANEVFQKKYGDCKDNTSLLFKMLEIAGIKGHLAWIGTRSIPYSYSDVPTPSVDNHMVLYYEYEGKPYFLDATGRFIPMELPTSFIQGKEALVSYGKDSFEIKEVPIIDPDKSVFKDYSTIYLDGNGLKGSSNAAISGYIKINLLYEIERLDSKDKVRDFYNGFFEKGNNSFLVTNFTEKNQFDYDNDLLIDYEFKVSNHAKSIGDEIYINLNLIKGISNLKTEDDRKMPLEHSYLDSYEFENKLIIPEGYNVEYIPENIEISTNNVSSSITYTIEKNQIVYNHKIEHNTLLLDQEKMKEVNDVVKKIEKEYMEVIVLKKNN